MMPALVSGLLVGTGLWIVWSGWRPVPESLGAALARLEREPLPLASEVDADRDTRVGRRVLQAVPPLARVVEGMRADLRIIGQTPEEHAARVATYTAMALFAGPWLALVARIAGVTIPVIVPAAVSLVGAGWGILAPFARVRNAATKRREIFAYALSVWCDVVVMSLAAGRGVEQAMETGAASGSGWAFAELRGAFGAAYMRGEPPWTALATLGRELKVKDLEELSSTISMAGEEGAAVRETLATKSRTIRERRTSQAEHNAAAATEKMSLPAVLVVFGFMVFLGFPTVITLFQGDF
jgi:Flp pilus assembly protein TadB